MPESIEDKPLLLLIDDSPQDLRLLGSLIKEQGQILFATSGREGLKLAAERTPDLIMLDVELPDLSGFEVCRELQQNPETRGSSIIFVTSHQSPQHEVAALEAGAVDFISKPFNPPVICARVKIHLTLKRQNKLLQSLVSIDGLTGVFNRRYFDEQSEVEWKRHFRQGHSLGLAMVDVDHFKQFNDRFGHSAGDECLKTLARTFQQSTRRPGEFLARYGGEEFVFVLPHLNQEDILRFGQHLCAEVLALKIPHPASSAQFVTISLGAVASVPTPETQLQLLVEQADQALYQAKASGRNRCQLFNSTPG
jgi:diguanylate cyclase (GGDEF)-like protein